MSELSTIVTRNITILIERPALNGQAVDLDGDLLDHYGLTSLSMVLLLTSVCEEAQIDLAKITEDDLSRLRTGRDIIKLAQSIEAHGTPA